MKKIVNFLITEIIYNGHLQALGAVGIVYISSVIAFNKRPGIDLLVLIYCVFQFIYYFDRYRDIAKDEITNTTRSAHLKTYHNKVPFIMAGLFLIVVIGNFLFGNTISLISSLAVMFLGAMYPVFFKGLTKKFFMFKNLYVAFVHALLVFYPLVYYSVKLQNTKTLVVLFLLILLEAIIAQVALDTKDIKSDKKDKLLTFPVVFGKEKAINFIQYGSVFSLVIFLYFGIANNLGSSFSILLFGTIIINQYIAYKIQKEKVGGVLIAAAKFSFLLGLAFISNLFI